MLEISIEIVGVADWKESFRNQLQRSVDDSSLSIFEPRISGASGGGRRNRLKVKCEERSISRAQLLLQTITVALAIVSQAAQPHPRPEITCEIEGGSGKVVLKSSTSDKLSLKKVEECLDKIGAPDYITVFPSEKGRYEK